MSRVTLLMSCATPMTVFCPFTMGMQRIVLASACIFCSFPNQVAMSPILRVWLVEATYKANWANVHPWTSAAVGRVTPAERESAPNSNTKVKRIFALCKRNNWSLWTLENFKFEISCLVSKLYIFQIKRFCIRARSRKLNSNFAAK